MFINTKIIDISKLVFLSILLAAVVLPQAALAKTARERCDEFARQFNITSDNGEIESGNLVAGLPDFCTAEELLLDAIEIALTLAGSVAVLFIIVGGFWYLTSGGNEEQAEKGKKTLINSIIGLVIIVMSFAIVRIVVNTLSSSSGGDGGGSQNQSSQTGGGRAAGEGGGGGNFGSGNLSQQELTQAAAALSGNVQISDQGGGNVKVSAFLYNNADAENVNKLCAVQSPTAGGIRVMFEGSQVASQAFVRQGSATYKAEVTAKVPQSGLMQVYICNVPIAEQQVSAGGG